MLINEPEYTWNLPLVKRKKTSMLILHHAAVSGEPVESVHAFHQRRGWAGIGYHYYVQKDGNIYRGRPEDVVGAHTAGYNTGSIGICFEGNFENDVMGEAQLSSGRQLICDILTRYPGCTIDGHNAYDATACPGRNFPMEDIKNFKEDDYMANMTQEKFKQLYDEMMSDFKDNDAASWSEKGRQFCVDHGIVVGDGAAEPNYQWGAAMTREMMATMLERFARVFGLV